MCDIYTHIVEDTPLGLLVNFHFDFEDELIAISSARNKTAHLEILLKQPHPLFIRIPGWAPADSVILHLNGRMVQPEWIGRFVFLSVPSAPSRILIEYDLPLTHLDEVTDGINYHFTWRGDEIIAMTPNTPWLPFYPEG